MHIINKLFKKIIKSILLFSPFPCISIVSISCHQISPVRHEVGSEWTVGKGECQSSFKFNSFSYEVIDNNLEIQVNINITPSKHGYDLFIGGKDKFLSPIGFYWIEFIPNQTKSIERRGFDVFQKEVWNESIFIYVYEIPISTFTNLQNEYNWFVTENDPNVSFNVYLDGIHYLYFAIDVYSIMNTQNSTN